MKIKIKPRLSQLRKMKCAERIEYLKIKRNMIEKEIRKNGIRYLSNLFLF